VLADNLKKERKENEQLKQALEHSNATHKQQQITLLQKEQRIDEQTDAIQELQSKLDELLIDSNAHNKNDQDDVDDEKQKNITSNNGSSDEKEKKEDDHANDDDEEKEDSASVNADENTVLINKDKKSASSANDKIESEIASSQNDACCIVFPWFRR